MLDWLKRIKTPAGGEPPIGGEDRTPEGEERLGRLLDRLGTDRRSVEPPAADAPGEIDPPPAIEAAASDSHAAASLSEITALLGTDTDPCGRVADPLPLADRETGEEAEPEMLGEIDPLQRTISAAVADALSKLEPLPIADDEPAEQPAPEARRDIEPAPSTPARSIRKPAAQPSPAAEPPPTPRRPAAGEVTGGSSGMRVIAVCSQKGGSGKTTIAAHMAVRAGMTGHGPAVLIDTDPQGSLGEWWRARHDDTPALATVKLEDLAANLAELRSYGTAVAVIDTPPALTASIEQVIAVADLILIPARPSPHDLRAVGATVEMVRRAGKPFLFVVNGAAPRASITAQAVAALSEHGRVAPVILYQRTEYAASMIDGRTVIEAAPSGRSAQEIAELWQCVYAQIRTRVAA